jgi:hypothetical protein
MTVNFVVELLLVSSTPLNTPFYALLGLTC